ncbi:MAG: hypothetical protein ACYC6L_13695, partial [Anaerolineae bacterium]
MFRRYLGKYGYPAIAGIFYLTYILVQIYPVSLHPFRLLVGQAYDTYQHLWSTWWYRYSLTVLHVNPNNLVTLFYPFGVYNPVILASPLPHLFTIPLQPILGLIGTYNFFLIISFPLCGLAMYALAYDLTRSHLGSAVAGFVYAFFPAKMMHIFGHYLEFHLYWLPLYVLFLLRTIKSPTWKNALLAGIFLALSTLSHIIHAAYFVIPVTLIVLLYYLVAMPKSILALKSLAFLSMTLIVGVMIALPFLLPYITSNKAAFEVGG